jgi:hypothetical protein
MVRKASTFESSVRELDRTPADEFTGPGNG